MGFGASYIRDLTVSNYQVCISRIPRICLWGLCDSSCIMVSVIPPGCRKHTVLFYCGPVKQPWCNTRYCSFSNKHVVSRSFFIIPCESVIYTYTYIYIYIYQMSEAYITRIYHSIYRIYYAGITYMELYMYVCQSQHEAPIVTKIDNTSQNNVCWKPISVIFSGMSTNVWQQSCSTDFYIPLLELLLISVSMSAYIIRYACKWQIRYIH